MAVGSIFMLLAGFPVVSSFAARDGLLQTLTADAFRGRVFGALGAIQGLATLVGLMLGAAAIDAIGVVPVVSLGAAMWIVGGVFALAQLAPDVGDTTARSLVRIETIETARHVSSLRCAISGTRRPRSGTSAWAKAICFNWS